jgi:hypothetical protein
MSDEQLEKLYESMLDDDLAWSVGGRDDVVVGMSCSLVSAMRTLLLRRFDRR